ncbi:MAG: DUF5107 domain-containing protein [Deltaproteobacteria bacterium]|nr:DUF5107 domain-containing protein [Deltaproteobacteria bacterium]
MRSLPVLPRLVLLCLVGCTALPDELGRSGIECEGPDGCMGEGAAEPSAVTVTAETLRLERSYAIDEPSQDNGFTTRYRTAERHPFDLHLMKVENEHGLALWFVVDGAAEGPSGAGRAPYGARLFRATFGGEELLYTNQDGRLSPNWGPREVGSDRIVGWVGLGGAESAFPVEEHGYYSAVSWSYRYETRLDGSLAFTVSTTGDPGGDGSSRLDVSVTYVVPADGPYFTTRVRIANPDSWGKSYQYWHNFMLPAGRGDDRHDIEVLLPGVSRVPLPDGSEVQVPEVSRIEVHSTGDGALRAPGSLEDGGHSRFPFVPGGKVSRIHGPQDAGARDGWVQGWLGFFSAERPVSRYGFFDRSRTLGLGMVSPNGEPTIWPKAFGGPGIGTDNWTADGSRYVEMWYSVSSRSFWDWASLAPSDGLPGGIDELSHEVIVFPLRDPGELTAFDPAHPESYRPARVEEPGSGTPAEDETPVEDFAGPVATASDGTATGTYDADWQIWYDGDRWGGGHSLQLEGGRQHVGLEAGSFGLRRVFGDVGGRTLRIAHRFGGGGWYEVLAGNTILVKYETAIDRTDVLALPAGATEVRLKVGSMGGGYHEAVISELTIE